MSISYKWRQKKKTMWIWGRRETAPVGKEKMLLSYFWALVCQIPLSR